MLTIHLPCPPRETRRRLPSHRLPAVVLEYAVRLGILTDGEVDDLAAYAKRHYGVRIKTPHTDGIF